ncbi:hypothetical protein ACLOJK_010138 [Asimina triloba]
MQGSTDASDESKDTGSRLQPQSRWVYIDQRHLIAMTVEFLIEQFRMDHPDSRLRDGQDWQPTQTQTPEKFISTCHEINYSYPNYGSRCWGIRSTCEYTIRSIGGSCYPTWLGDRTFITVQSTDNRCNLLPVKHVGFTGSRGKFIAVLHGKFLCYFGVPDYHLSHSPRVWKTRSSWILKAACDRWLVRADALVGQTTSAGNVSRRMKRRRTGMLISRWRRKRQAQEGLTWWYFKKESVRRGIAPTR